MTSVGNIRQKTQSAAINGGEEVPTSIYYDGWAVMARAFRNSETRFVNSRDLDTGKGVCNDGVLDFGGAGEVLELFDRHESLE